MQEQWQAINNQNQLNPQQSMTSLPQPAHFDFSQPPHIPAYQQPLPSPDASANMTYNYASAPWLSQSQSTHDQLGCGSAYPPPPHQYGDTSYASSPFMAHDDQVGPVDPSLQLDYSQMYAEEYAKQCSPMLEQPTFVLTKRSDTPFDDNNSETAYAHLLFKCLEAAPDHKMGLRDIYSWMYDNCPRVRDVNNKGWQNSVRHNLSMNKGFEKVPSPSGSTSKKGTMWRLSDDALLRGHVLSTTQYRKKTKKVNPRRREYPAAPQRVSAGSKGGLASKRAQEKRRQEAALMAPTSAPAHIYHAMSRHSSPALTDGSSSPQSTFSPHEPLFVAAYGSPQIFNHSRSATPDSPTFMNYNNVKAAPTSNPASHYGFDQISGFNHTHGYNNDDNQSELLDNINVNRAPVVDPETERQDFDLFFGNGHALASPGFGSFPNH
ncbi:Forkhead domain-containing protein 1 [Elsinoe fawcettii]|nr:Forkhead domain-containing protein 1 [Elsinoe fawcettii]